MDSNIINNNINKQQQNKDDQTIPCWARRERGHEQVMCRFGAETCEAPEVSQDLDETLQADDS